MFSLYAQDVFCQEKNTMFFKNMKIVFRKPSIGTTRQRGRGRQKGIISSLNAFLQEQFEWDIEPAISPKRTLDFVFAHWHFAESMVEYCSLLCALMLQEVDSMNGYMTTKEDTEKWGITQRQVQNHCKMNRIPGVLTHGTTYMIPENAERPVYGFFSGQPSEKGNTEK